MLTIVCGISWYIGRPWLATPAHEQMMSLPLAAADYREFLARERNPQERVAGLRSLVRILIHRGERDEARERQSELARHIADQTPSIVDQLNEGRLRRLEGDKDGALNQVTAIIQKEKNNLSAIELRGTLSMDRGDYVAAEVDLQNVINHEPWNKQAHYKLALTLARLGREQEAAVYLKENRRLLSLSNRIVNLQRKGNLNTEETTELINALVQTGMHSIADTVRQRLR